MAMTAATVPVLPTTTTNDTAATLLAPQPPSGPRHVREILDRVVWKLLVVRETARAKERPS